MQYYFFVACLIYLIFISLSLCAAHRWVALFLTSHFSVMKRWMLWASVLALSAATACKKNNDPESTLPPATQDGRNTAGWLANGQPQVASNYDGDIVFSSPSPALRGSYGADSVLSLTMTGYKDNANPEVSFFLKASTPGTYRVGSRQQRGLSIAGYANCSYRNIDHTTTPRYTGRVVITRLDTRNGAASGLFEFRAVNYQDSTKTVTVTNGRFDYAGR